MELASMLAGARFTDHPASVSPVIGAFLRGYNDLINDGRRQDLYECAARIVGSRAPAAVQRRRADCLTAWAVRTRTRHWTRCVLPARWRATGIDTHVPLYAAPDYALRSIWRVTDETHAAALALIDELLTIDSRARAAELKLGAPSVPAPRRSETARPRGADMVSGDCRATSSETRAGAART
jgi:hypothetical protein